MDPESFILMQRRLSSFPHLDTLDEWDKMCLLQICVAVTYSKPNPAKVFFEWIRRPLRQDSGASVQVLPFWLLAMQHIAYVCVSCTLVLFLGIFDYVLRILKFKG